MGIITNFKRGWNAFFNKDPTEEYSYNTVGDSLRPDRVILNPYNGRSIMAPVINRIAIDAANIEINHVKVDKNGNYIETVFDELNDIFNFSANIDQSGQKFKEDLYMSLLDEGCVAVVPVDCSGNPIISDAFKIQSARVGKITEWRPDKVRVKIYNDRTGEHDELWYPKRISVILENPLYQVMNARNSTLQRLIRKLNLLDSLDERNNSGKLDLIIQLPYTLKTQQKRAQAELRKKDLEDQLANSAHGIAYTDAVERIIQLNRPVENNLISQIQELTTSFYNQIGMTQTIFDGTADEATMINYENRSLNVIVNELVNEVRRKWISSTARTLGHSFMSIKDPFRHLTVTAMADAADKFTRNEILSSNEVRAKIGYKPSGDPDADKLMNKNINQSESKINDNEERMEPDT